MSFAFISYNQRDRKRAGVLVEQLRSRDIPVWWDQDIEPGTTYRKVIKQRLHESACVVVLWSKHSIGAPWVLGEADAGLRRSVLVPVLLDDVEIPLGFGEVQTVSLVRSLRDAEALDNVAAGARRLIGHTVPEGTTRGRSRGGGSSTGGKRGLLIGGVVVALATAVGLALWWDGGEGQRQEEPGPGPVVTDGDGTTGEGRENGSHTAEPSAPRKDPRLVEAQDELAALIAAPNLDLGQLLTHARQLLHTIDAKDPRTGELLDDLADRVANDPERKQQVADVRRWFGQPVGAGERYDASLESFEEHLEALELDAAGMALADCRKILREGRELSGAQQRLTAALALRDDILAVKAELQDGPRQLTAFAAARQRGQELADREPGFAEQLGLLEALAQAGDAYDQRMGELLDTCRREIESLGDAPSARRLVTALTSLDDALAQLPPEEAADLQGTLERAADSGSRRVLGSDDDHRAPLALLSALGDGRTGLAAAATRAAADSLEQDALEHLAGSLTDPDDDQQRARFLRDLAPCEAGLAGSSAADQLVQLAAGLLADIARAPAAPEAPGDEPIREALARMDQADVELERLQGLFPAELPGRIGTRVAALFDSVRSRQAADLHFLRGRFSEAQELLDAGRESEANDIYTDLLRQSEPGTAVRAAARVGKAEIKLASLPEQPSRTDQADIDKAIDLFNKAREEGELRDLWGRSIPAYCLYRVIPLHAKLRYIYQVLSDGQTKVSWVSKANNQAELKSEALALLRGPYGHEKDHDGRLLIDKLGDD